MPSIEILDTNGQRVQKRYYVLGEHVGFDEDMTHEYKGHLNFSINDVPLWARDTAYDRASRQPISRAINGFLNTGSGGTVYLGVKDEGTAFGVYLHRYKMDHILQNLEDLMSRYKPPVEPHRYNVKFVPVVEPNISQEDIKKAVTFDPSLNVDAQRRQQKHQLRTPSYCWCDKDLQAQCNTGCLPLQYVIEVKIEAWDPKDQRNQNAVGLLKVQPFHEDECGRVHVRRGACTTVLTTEEIQNYAKHVVECYYSGVAKKLERDKAKMLELD